eukprot:Lankesteria_metandrocarpae@DN3391_c0_g1_i2.p1
MAAASAVLSYGVPHSLQYDKGNYAKYGAYTSTTATQLSVMGYRPHPDISSSNIVEHRTMRSGGVLQEVKYSSGDSSALNSSYIIRSNKRTYDSSAQNTAADYSTNCTAYSTFSKNYYKNSTIPRIPNVKLNINGKNCKMYDVANSKNGIIFGVHGGQLMDDDPHLQGYVDEQHTLADAFDYVACLSVNDSHVLRSWRSARKVSKFVMIADSRSKLSKALGIGEGLSCQHLGSRYLPFALMVRNCEIVWMRVGEGSSAEKLKAAAEVLLGMQFTSAGLRRKRKRRKHQPLQHSALEDTAIHSKLTASTAPMRHQAPRDAATSVRMAAAFEERTVPQQYAQGSAPVPQQCPQGSAHVPQQCPQGSAHVPQQCPQGSAHVPQQYAQGSAHVPQQYAQGSAHVQQQYAQGSVHVPQQYA